MQELQLVPRQEGCVCLRLLWTRHVLLSLPLAEQVPLVAEGEVLVEEREEGRENRKSRERAEKEGKKKERKEGRKE